MSTDARTRTTGTTHISPALVAAVMGIATSAVTVAVGLGAPAAAATAPDSPDRCGPASSSASDFVDRITFRKEQMSRDRAVRPR